MNDANKSDGTRLHIPILAVIALLSKPTEILGKAMSDYHSARLTWEAKREAYLVRLTEERDEAFRNPSPEQRLEQEKAIETKLAQRRPEILRFIRQWRHWLVKEHRASRAPVSCFATRFERRQQLATLRSAVRDSRRAVWSLLRTYHWVNIDLPDLELRCLDLSACQASRLYRNWLTGQASQAAKHPMPESPGGRLALMRCIYNTHRHLPLGDLPYLPFTHALYDFENPAIGQAGHARLVQYALPDDMNKAHEWMSKALKSARQIDDLINATGGYGDEVHVAFMEVDREEYQRCMDLASSAWLTEQVDPVLAWYASTDPEVIELPFIKFGHGTS